MSCADFKMCQCCMSLLLNISSVPCQIQEMLMSHVTILSETTSLSLKGEPTVRCARNNDRNLFNCSGRKSNENGRKLFKSIENKCTH